MENEFKPMDKKLSKYEFKVIKINDLNNYDYLKVEFSINDALKNLILTQYKANDDKIDYNLLNGGNEEEIRTRYLCKSFILNELYSSCRYILTDVELLKDNKTTIKFYSITQYNRFINDTKMNIKRLIELIRDIKNINIKVSYEETF